MIGKCYNCFRTKKSCLCSSIDIIDTGVKFVFLMHPQEAFKQKTGTGRLSSLSLANSEIIIGEEFNHNSRVKELLESDDYFPLLLYPSKDAFFAESYKIRDNLGSKKLLLFLVDATWSQAKKMLKNSSNLLNIPKLTFSRKYISQYEFKTQPESYCLSTIETSYYLIKELQKGGVVETSIDPEGLMKIFKKLVRFQKECEKVKGFTSI